MPFTFAHPAIVLPIKKKWSNYFNLTALVLGSMAPDFEYFIKLRIENKIGHYLIGFVTFNLPLVIIFSLIFHCVIKNTLIVHLPAKVNSLIKQEEKQNLYHKSEWIKWILIFISSAIIGMFSHTLWDSFTHESGYFVLMFPVLKSKIYIIPVYKFLQHGGTIMGFCVIFKFLYDARSREHCKWQTVSCGRKILYWTSVFIFTVSFIIVRLINETQYFTIRALGTFIVTSISGLFLSITLASVIFYKKSREWERIYQN